MAKPKLALIPAAQGSKLFSVLPSSGVGDFDFTRSGSATRINSQGLIETVGNGVSRLNYPMIDGKVVGCPHHILEPARTNLITYSEDFSEWSIARATLEADAITSPDGGLTYKLKESTDTGSHPLYFQGITVSASASHTMSIFFKAAGRSIFRINLTNGGSATYFDLSTEDVTSGTGNIENYGNGWYRCSTTFTTTGTNQEVYIEPVISGTTQSYTGDGVSGLYVYGAQLEESSYLTSYIPTNGSTVTRNAETANDSGDATTFNDSEGVLMVETSALANDLNIEGISISDGSSSNRVVFFKWNLSNSIRARVTSSGVNTLNQTITISDVTTLNKIAIKYKLNDFAIWINGIKLFTDTSGSTPIGLNELNFNSDGIGGAPFRGNTKQLQYFQTALTDSELEQLTSWISFTDMAEGQLYSVE